MIIKIMGPVGSGKSTVSKKLAEVLSLKYIPEMEEHDVTFFRLLYKRNKHQTSEDKMNFQCYTFEQAYKRQFRQDQCIIDVPIEQHFLMAKSSLSEEEFKEYNDYYGDYVNRPDKSYTFILNLPFEETLERIKMRGRREETLSEEEISFYRRVYNELQEFGKSGKAIFIDESKGSESAVNQIFDKIGMGRTFVGRE